MPESAATTACLDEDALIGFARGRLLAPERERAEAHLRGCESCRRAVGVLAREPRSAGALVTQHGAGSTTGADGFQIGTQVGRYVLLERVGTGGMGEVHAAYDPELERRVAVKLLRTGTLPPDRQPEAHARLLREAQAMARIASPHVVSVHDVGVWDGQVFIAMELLGGCTLRTWLETPRGWRSILAVFVDAGQGLADAHAAGLIHRDFKPENVLVDERGRARVTDFGLARALPSDPPSTPTHASPGTTELLTQSGALLGTPVYMAPEQLRGEQVDARADQFSFCVALYEALLGQRPYAGATTEQLLLAMVTRQTQPLPSGARIPGWLRRVITRGLSPDPQQRFPSMSALLATLHRDRRSSARAAVFGLCLTLSAVGGVLGHGWLSRRSGLCSGATRELEAAWGPARQQAVERSLLSSGAPHARESWERVRATLTRYAADWSAAHQDNCAATRISGEQSEALLDQRMACLGERRMELESLTQLLARTGNANVDRAVTALGTLQQPASCSPTRVLGWTDALATSPALRESRRALKAKISQGNAHFALGEYQEALRLGDESARDAQGLGSRRLQAEAFLLHADALEAMGDYLAASKRLDESAVAATAANDPQAAAAAWISRALMSTAHRLSRPEEGLQWGRYAAAALERAGNPVRAEASLHEALGALHEDLGHFTEAEREYRDALALRESEAAGDPLLLTRALYPLGILLHRVGRLNEAIPLNERVVELAVKALGPSHPDIGIYRHALGIKYMDAWERDKSLAELQGARVIVEQMYKAPHAMRGQLWLTFGTLYSRREQHAEAVEMGERAVDELLRVYGEAHTTVAVARLYASQSLVAAGNLDRAQTLIDLAIAHSRDEVSRNNGVYGTCINAAGDVAYAKKDFRLAVGLFQEGLESREKSLGTSHPYVGEDLTDLGEALLALRKPKEAAVHLERALALWNGRSDADPMERARTRFGLAKTLTALGDSQRAEGLARQALEDFERLHSAVGLASWKVWRGAHPQKSL